MDVLAAIHARRSTKLLIAPGPSPSDMEVLLEAAAAAPDHGHLRPWTFKVLEGREKDDFGVVLHDAYLARCRATGVEPSEGQRAKERNKLDRAPTVVVVGAVRRPSLKVPFAEQLAAVAAAAQNMLLAATALGFGSMWRTGDPAYDDAVKAGAGLSPDDAIVGFIYLGTIPPTTLG